MLLTASGPPQAGGTMQQRDRAACLCSFRSKQLNLTMPSLRQPLNGHSGPAGDDRRRLGLPQPSLARGLSTAGLRHIRTKPYTPRTKGKAERFIQTGLREWAYAQAYASSQARQDALADRLGHYNTHRPGQPTAGHPARPDPVPWFDRRDRSFVPT
jgi:hypothetical protein